jgi:hypothetical protein
MPRSLDEIAEDVAGFGLTIAKARALLNWAVSFHRSLQRYPTPNFKALKKAVKEDREWLRKRGDRRAREFPWVGTPLAGLYNKAADTLDPKETGGPDVRFRWFDYCCAHVAYNVIAQSRNPRMGDRLRTLAGYLYEAATGEPDHNLETACRRVTAEKRREKAL